MLVRVMLRRWRLKVILRRYFAGGSLDRIYKIEQDLFR